MGLRVDLPNLVDVKTGIALSATRQANGTVNGTSVDRRENRGRGYVVLEAGIGTGTAPTLDVAVQDSTDDVTFATVATSVFAGFTQVTTAYSKQTVAINLDEADRYIRARPVVAGAAGGGFIYTVSFIFPAGPDVPSPS